MKESNIDLAVITDDDSLYYFTGYHDFLHMDFNRPTILLVSKDGESTLITPLLDVLLVPDDTPVNKIETWNDGCLLYTSPSPRDRTRSRMPSSA